MAAREDLPLGENKGSGVQTQTPPPAGAGTPPGTEPITLTTPFAGERVRVDVAPGQELYVDFDLRAQELSATESDLVIEFANGGVIVLSDFALYAAGNTPPLFILADGTEIPGDAVVFAFGDTAIEPAAGPELAGGGAGEYRDDLGDLIGGLDRLGTLDPDLVPTPAEFALDEEAAPAIEAAPEEPANEPPVAIDDVVAANITEAIAVNTPGPNAGIYLVDLSEEGSGYRFLFNPGFALDDLAFDGGGTLWATGFGQNHSNLYTIDLLTQQVTEAATLDGIVGKVTGIVFVGETLYALSGDSLYTVTIDGGTATATEVITDLGYQAKTDLVAQDGHLYFVSSSGHLIGIDLADNTVSDLGDLGTGPGPYGIVPGTIDGNGVLYLVNNSSGNPSFREVVVIDPGDGGFTVLDAFDLTTPQGEGQFKGLAGELSVETDGIYTGNVLPNDFDPDSDPLTVVGVADADEDATIPTGGSAILTGAYGTLELFSDGSYTYTLTSEAPGQDVFTYTVSDGTSTSSADLIFNVNSLFAQHLVLGSEEGETLTGTSGDDLILGGEGADSLFGEGGDDILIGGGGDDDLSGGAGSDIFVFSALGGAGSDIIRDFSVADGDVIRLTDVLDPGSIDATVALDGDDVILTLNASGNVHEVTTVTLEGLNAEIGLGPSPSLDDLITANVVEIAEEDGL